MSIILHSHRAGVEMSVQRPFSDSLAQGPLLLLSLRLQDDGGAGGGADRHDLLHRGAEIPLQRVLRRRQSCGELARSL